MVSNFHLHCTHRVSHIIAVGQHDIPVQRLHYFMIDSVCFSICFQQFSAVTRVSGFLNGIGMAGIHFYLQQKNITSHPCSPVVKLKANIPICHASQFNRPFSYSAKESGSSAILIHF